MRPHQLPDPASTDPSQFLYFLGNEHGGLLVDQNDLAMARCACSPSIAKDAVTIPVDFYPDAKQGTRELYPSMTAWKPGQAPLYGPITATGVLYDNGMGGVRMTAATYVVNED